MLPEDFDDWYDVVKAMVQHAVDRYTLEVVQTWHFECWNELWGLPQPRFPIWAIKLGKAMREVDAEIYYQRCAGTVTGVVSRFCRRHGKRFVFAIANDRDVDGSFTRSSSLLTRTSYHAGLRHALRVRYDPRGPMQPLQHALEECQGNHLGPHPWIDDPRSQIRDLA